MLALLALILATVLLAQNVQGEQHNQTILINSPMISWSPSTLGVVDYSGWNARFGGNVPGQYWPNTVGTDGSWRETNVSGASAALTWTGTGVGFTGYSTGSATIVATVDGSPIPVTVQTNPNSNAGYSATTRNLTYGTHTISITYTRPNPGQYDFFDLSSFTILTDAVATNSNGAELSPSVQEISTDSGYPVINPNWTPTGAWPLTTRPVGGADSKPQTPFKGIQSNSNQFSLSVAVPPSTNFFYLTGSVAQDHGPYSVTLASTDGKNSSTTNLNGYNPYIVPDQMVYYATVDPKQTWTATIKPLGNDSQWFTLQKATFFTAANSTTSGSSSGSGSSSSSNVAAIAGGVGGGVGALIILGALFYFCVYRKRKAAKTTENTRAINNKYEIEPYKESPEDDLASPVSAYNLASSGSPLSLTGSHNYTSVSGHETAKSPYTAFSAYDSEGRSSPFPYPATAGASSSNGDSSDIKVQSPARRSRHETNYIQEEDGGRFSQPAPHVSDVLVPPTYNPAWVAEGSGVRTEYEGETAVPADESPLLAKGYKS